MTGAMTERRWRLLAVLLAGVAVGCVVAAVVLVGPAGYSWDEALTSFLATNGLMGVSFAVSGLLIAFHRRRNPVGWLLIGDGLGHAVAALMAPLSQLAHDHGSALWVQKLLVTVFMGSWPWSIGLFLPLVLLLFPDGHLPGRGWRYVAWAIALTSPLFALEMVAGPEPVSDGLPLGYLAFDLPDSLAWLWTLSEVRTLAALALGLVSLLVRYRRADEVGRRQLLWLLLAAVVVVAAVLPWSFVAGTPIAVLFTIPLIPAAIAIAVLRYQLLDIRLVLARALAWLLLSAAALAAYVALVAVLDMAVSRTFGESPFAPVAVAVLLAPLLPRLQREVERWMYGDRRDPARVASRLSEHLAAGDERGLQGVVGSLRRRCGSRGSRSPTGPACWPRTASDPSTWRPFRCPTQAPRWASSRSGCARANASCPASTPARCGWSLRRWRWRWVRCGSPPTCRPRANGWWPRGRRSGAGSAATSTTGSDPRSPGWRCPRTPPPTSWTATRTGPGSCCPGCAITCAAPSPTYAGWSTTCARRRSTRSASSGRSSSARTSCGCAPMAARSPYASSSGRPAPAACRGRGRGVPHRHRGPGQRGPARRGDLGRGPGPVQRRARGRGDRRRRPRHTVGARCRAVVDARARGRGRRHGGGRTVRPRRPGARVVPPGRAMTIRVLVADDHPIVRAGLTALLDSLPDIEVAGVAADGREAVRLAVTERPDVALLDLRMPELDGIAATRELGRVAPEVAVLVLTMLDDDDSVFAAMRAGARGYLVKGVEQDDIARAIRSVASGEAIFGPGVAQRVLSFLHAPPQGQEQVFPELTAREHQILDLLAAGLNNAAIAERIGAAPKTVANNVSTIFTKLQVADRAQAIVRARDAGLGRG